MNIMIVDDEAIQLDSLNRGLRSKGYQVQGMGCPEEALSFLNDHEGPVDLVITDYAMPGMNGMELLKQIRERHKSLPVIMMTAYGEKSLVIDAMRHRCDSFIEKPFTLDELLQEIQRAEINRVQNADSHHLMQLIPKLIHQANNPLQAIMGSAELGMFELDDVEAMKDRLTSIVEATARIRTINKGILNLGRSVEDKMAPVGISTIIDDCLHMFQDLITLKGIQVNPLLIPKVVLGNRFGLEQLFKNLFLNAVDAMDGRPEKLLNVRMEMDGDAQSISIYVEDSGCGIPCDKIDTVFSTYYTSKENGTGLGLAVIKDIVEKHRGHIQVRSEVGKGTSFIVELPVMQQEHVD